MIQDQVKPTGQVNIKIVGPDGKVKEDRTVPNAVVFDGKEYIASRLTGTPTAMSHMAVGSDNTAVDATSTGDAALGTELGRVTLTSSTAASNVVTYVASFPAGTGTGAVVEAGIFNAASGGVMLARTVFSVVNKGADDAMTITWAITVS